VNQELHDLIIRASKGDVHALGAAISPLDDRDFVQYPPAPGAPDQVIIPGVGACPVYEQQGGTCTGYALAACMTYLEYKESGKIRTFDGAEIHHRITPSWAEGVWPREVLEDIKAHGALAPFDASSSGMYRIAGYAGVPLDPDSILTALSSTGPVQLVTWLGKTFFDQWYDSTPDFIPAPAVQEPTSLHSMLIVAADRARGAVIQNNWGVEGVPDSGGKIIGKGLPFGGHVGGFNKVSWAWLAMQGVEAWAMTDASNATGAGWIRTHGEVVRDDGWALVKRPDKPAVYAIINKSRDWISSQNELYSRGLGGKPVEIRDKSDAVWGYPVLGEDAPAAMRA
jgi:hypothetical protein